MQLLKQRTMRFKSGERFPLLMNSAEQPVFLPNVYLAAMRRSRNVASNTLQRDGRAIMHLYAWALKEGIELEERFRAGQFLSLGEIESLRGACSWFYETLTAQCNKGESEGSGKGRIIPLPGTQQVASETVLVRMITIGAYLDWLAVLRFQRVADVSSQEAVMLDESRKRMAAELYARRPNGAGRSVLGEREGLSKEAQERILEIVVPIEVQERKPQPATAEGYTWSPDNPWKRPQAKFRNSLMILVLYFLGIRSGELLGLKVTDINFQTHTIRIRRSPDDPDDPRLHEPNTKTRDRDLPMNAGLAAILHRYVQGPRRKSVPRKGDHLYLWVTASGAPLSISGLKKVWHVLRSAVPGIPEDICAHKFRHTWNDLFSEKMDQKNESEDTEKQQRSYLMGWRPTSDTAATYTRRHTRKAAEKASLDLQREVWGE